MPAKPITSEAVERIRAHLRAQHLRYAMIKLDRIDVEEAIDDYDTLAETYMRIVRGLSETQ